MKNAYFFIGAALLAACSNHLTVDQQRVDRTYLASTSVHTPDPRQENPPYGQMLIVDWRVPDEILQKKPHVKLHLLFRNYTEKTVDYPITKNSGSRLYRLFNQEYEDTKGLLTYKAEIITEDDQVYKTWKHQMWVNLITIKESGEVDFEEDIENFLPASEIEDIPNEDQDTGTPN